MIDIKKISQVLQGKIEAAKEGKVSHVIINAATPVLEDDKDKKKKIENARLDKILELAKIQAESDIPILTISLGSNKDLFFDDMLLYDFFDTALKKECMATKTKVSVIGKWYSITGMVVEAIKGIMDATKDNSDFLLNICINYDGQEEIVDACRLMLLKISDGKMSNDSATKESIKENIYSSFLSPPELIIELTNMLSGTFLWDSKGAKVYFVNKHLQDFSRQDLLKAIENYSKD
ncbi:MAG: undecaprenyl diphosphate synthase family protein [archaeon]